jgi:hypothetical protein
VLRLVDAAGKRIGLVYGASYVWLEAQGCFATYNGFGIPAAFGGGVHPGDSTNYADITGPLPPVGSYSPVFYSDPGCTTVKTQNPGLCELFGTITGGVFTPTQWRTATQSSGAVVPLTALYMRTASGCVTYCSTVSCGPGGTTVIFDAAPVADPTAGLVLPLYVVQQ